MSTNLHKSKQRRVTKQVRLRQDLHAKLKLRAIEEATTISRLLDGICVRFLDNRTDASRQDKNGRAPPDS